MHPSSLSAVIVVGLQSSLSLMAHTKKTTTVLLKLFNVNSGCEQQGTATNRTVHTNPNANIKKNAMCARALTSEKNTPIDTVVENLKVYHSHNQIVATCEPKGFAANLSHDTYPTQKKLNRKLCAGVLKSPPPAPSRNCIRAINPTSVSRKTNQPQS